ncbi:MAG: MFS transporter [Dehalococcoidia bacterium]
MSVGDDTPAVTPGGASAPRPVVPALTRTFVSLANRDFRLLSASTLASGFGQWGQQIALSWLVFLLTGSAAQLGAVAFAGGMLSLVLTPFGGTLADRYPRRTIIVIATAVGAAQSVVIAVLVFTDVVRVWHVYAFALISSLTAAANQPARQAYVYDASSPETLANAIAVNSIAQNVARIAGPPLAGALAAASVGAGFAFVALMHSLATLATLRMSRTPRLARGPARNPLREIGDGFRYLAADGRLRGLLALNALPALLVYPYISFLPVFASRVLGGGSFAYGLLVASIGAGSTVGLLLLAFLGDFRRKGLAMLGGFLAYFVLVIGFTQSPLLLLSIGALTVAGLFHGFALALDTTLFQLVVRDDMRGRGMAVWQMSFGLMPLGALPMGLAIARWGPQLGTAPFMLACTLAVTGIAVRSRALRAL